MNVPIQDPFLLVMEGSFKNTFKNIYSHKECINNFKEMSNINKFLNVPSLKVYIRQANFLTIQQAKKKCRHSCTQQIAEHKHPMYHVESLLSANRIGLNVKNDHEIRQCI